MGQITRCPLIGFPCGNPIIIEEKTFFLAEVEKPDDVRKRRIKAVTEAIGDRFKIRSALDEKGINAFTCKICEMIQACAYGIADITDDNPNVLFELGIMIALGKPTIILKRTAQEMRLNLPSDLNAIEIIPFTEYIDIIDPLRKVIVKLPSPALLPSPMEDIEKIKPQLAKELRNIGTDIVKEFRKSLRQAKLDTISLRGDKAEIPAKLSKRISNLEEKLDDMVKLGFLTDTKTVFLRGNYYYNEGKYNDALASYNWCLELSPDHPVYLHNRGITHHKLERYEEALVDYSRSLELRPDDPDTLNDRGITYRNLGKYEEALEDYNRALELRPNDFDTLNNRAVALSRQGKFKEALTDLNSSLEVRPDDPDAMYNLACLFSIQMKANEALACLKKAIDKNKKFREDAKTDEDFNNIRGDPRFKKLIESD